MQQATLQHTAISIQLDNLQERMQVVRDAIERNAEQSRRLATGRTSNFWAEIFGQRRIYPDLNDLMVCRREGTILGVGDDPQGSLERERAYSERVHHIFRGMVSRDFAKGLPETTFGSPLVFEHEGVSRSANFWINAATTRRVVEFVKSYGKAGPLRVLEIGPGWGGCVYQLHHSIEVESYTLVDLPENLYISTLHLGTVLPNREIEFIDVDGGKVTEIPAGTVCACLPGAIGRIQAKYDLVLNSFSMQEMDLESVREYIDWIETILSPEGIFVSLNSHAKAGVERPSDYRYEKFHIHHWGVFRSAPSGFFNTIPYEVVVGKRREQSPDYPAECQDGLGRLMQVGLDKDLEALSNALVRGTLSQRQQELLRRYNALFASDNDDARLRILEELKDIDASTIWPFVAALLLLVRDDRSRAASLLDQAINGGLSGFARVRAEIFRAGLAAKSGAQFKLNIVDGFDPAFAYPEADLIIKSGDLNHAIVHINRAFGRQH
jgi:putative sugar O-methyltransferase